MEPAVVDERAGVIELEGERAGLPVVVVGAGDQLVQAVVPGVVERIVADDGVVVGVTVDPGDRVAFRDREMERYEFVGLGDVDHMIVTVVVVVVA